MPTAEAKIRELCTRLLAAQNDEAANRILPELRDALREHRESLKVEVAKEYRSYTDEMAAD